MPRKMLRAPIAANLSTKLLAGNCFIVTEIWKPIAGVSGYEVSTHGRVRSLDRFVKTPKDKGTVFKHGKIISTYPDKDGYRMVILRVNGQKLRKKVHRLVAENFITNDENKPTVNHKDGKKENNSVENLEWATCAENSLHAKRVLGVQVGEKHHSAKLSLSQVKEIFCLLEDGKLTQREIASMYGVTPSMICCINRGKSWKCLPRSVRTL